MILSRTPAVAALPHTELEELARRALAEDLGDAGDITTKRVVRIDQPGKGRIIAKGAGVLAGAPLAEEVFHAIDRGTIVDWMLKDGDAIPKGGTIANIAGRARAILAAERVALNFLQHLSGVATQTAAFVEACAKHGVQVLCTRKTIPGLRAIQRYAVTVGGGQLHRAGLYDAILIKNNHELLAGGVGLAVSRVKAAPNLEVQAEVDDLDQLNEAIEAGADRVLLDNADLETIKQAVKITKGKVFLEVSGGISLDLAKKIARLKPDAISVGRITHSVQAVDMALHLE